MARPKITLFVDLVSPFAYMAYYLLRNDPVFNKCDITYVPIFLGGLFKICGTAPPLTIKNKDKWIAKERIWWSTAFSIPMKEDIPPDFPPMTLAPMRALSVIGGDGSGDDEKQQQQQQRLIKALDTLYAAYWVRHVPVHQPEILSSVLAEVLGGQDAQDIVERSKTEGKSLLVKNTNFAFEKGAFGLPWLSCTNANGEEDGFWGVDHLGQAAQFLGIEKLGTSDGWKALL